MFCHTAIATPCLRLAAAMVLAGIAAPSAAVAQTEGPFARKTVTIIVGYAPGGSYDLYARFVARALGRYLPGQPAVVVQNMSGAGSLQAANYLFKVAPKDGTALGVVAETLPMEQALQNPGVQFDAAIPEFMLTMPRVLH